MPVADVASAVDASFARAGIGAVAAAAIAGAAWRARALSPGGALAAVAVGTICAAAGWDWAILLIAFFLTSTALGRVRRAERERRIGDGVAKGGARDASQVIANGGAFTLAAVGWMLAPSPAWLAVGGGALAAAASDTWATEIGSLARGRPRHILEWEYVAPGTSGGITALGTAASVAGALLIGVLAAIAGWSRPVAVAVVVGGIAGSLADSLLGATVQVRRWCGLCNAATEQPVHICGAPTGVTGGISWIDNDAVNLISVVIGAAVALVTLAAQGLQTLR